MNLADLQPISLLSVILWPTTSDYWRTKNHPGTPTTVEQSSRLTSAVESALEPKKFLSVLFLDVSPTFDRIWMSKVRIQGLFHKVRSYLPSQNFKLLDSAPGSLQWYHVYRPANSSWVSWREPTTIGPHFYLLTQRTCQTPKTQWSPLFLIALQSILSTGTIHSIL